MARLKIDLCGPLAVKVDGQPAAGLTSPKMQALLAYLAVEDDRPHARTVLATLLWPERPEETARQNLRQTLSRLRRALGPAGADLLRISRDAVAWEGRAGVEVDYWTVRATAQQVARHAHTAPAVCDACCAAMAAAVVHYRGEFLAGLEPDSVPLEEWLLLQREWLRREVLAFHHHLVEHFEHRGQAETALTHAWAQIALDPLRETAHQQLMRLLARTGRFSDALAHYESLVTRLDDELGVTPAAETADLVARIRRGDLAAAPAAPAVRLPATFTPLVGRDAELAEIGRLLAGECRLLTLSGPGGVGKTRLALAAAAQLAPGFQDGVYFADLTDVTAADGVVDALAAALDLSFGGKADAAARRQALLGALAPRRVLLLLDNYEQLLPDVALPAALLAQAPHVALLTTSRAPLGLRAEFVLALTGLPLAEAVAADDPAVVLFTTAARRAQAGFTPDAAARRAIAAIARSVAGLPLGLELAAALIRFYPVATIARELEKSLDFATTTMSDVPARHRSLRAVYEHSVSLLDSAASRALRRLAIFSGPFSYDAAEALLDGDAASLRRLQEFGLVGNTEQGLLRLHPLLQQFAREALAEAGETEAVAAAHARYFAGWLTATLAADPPDLAARFLRAAVDVTQAWHWAVAAGSGDILQQILPYLQRTYLYSGRSDVGLALIAAASARYPSSDSAVRRMLFMAEGRFAYRRGLYPRAAAALRAGLALADEEAPAATVRGEMMLGHVLSKLGAYDEALATLRAALARAQAAGLTSREGDVRRIMGNIFLDKGDLLAAREAYERALPLTDADHPRGRAATLGNLGSVGTGTGDFGGARRNHLAALAVHQALGDVVSEVVTRCDLAELEREQGNFAASAAQLTAALAVLPAEGMAHVAADVQVTQAELSLTLAEYAVAADLLTQTAAVYKAVAEPLGSSMVQLLQARLLLALGMVEQAEQQLGVILHELAALNDIARLAEAQIWLSRLFTESGRGAQAAALATTALAGATQGERIPQAAAAQLALALALAAQNEQAGAREAARAALTQRRLLGQPHLAAGPLALLIRLALDGEDDGLLPTHVAELDGILEQWRGGGLLRFAAAYLAAVDGALALGDRAAARRLLTAGQMRLALAAEALDRPAWRHALTTRVAANRALLAREID